MNQPDYPAGNGGDEMDQLTTLCALFAALGLGLALLAYIADRG